jgi:hypothetical protein
VPMARRCSTFRQSDVERAIKAAKAAGVPISRVKIAPDGTITIDTLPTSPDAEPNEWDIIGEPSATA